jgi:hypothetical protein
MVATYRVPPEQEATHSVMASSLCITARQVCSYSCHSHILGQWDFCLLWHRPLLVLPFPLFCLQRELDRRDERIRKLELQLRGAYRCGTKATQCPVVLMQPVQQVLGPHRQCNC